MQSLAKHNQISPEPRSRDAMQLPDLTKDNKNTSAAARGGEWIRVQNMQRPGSGISMLRNGSKSRATTPGGKKIVIGPRAKIPWHKEPEEDIAVR